MLRVSPSAAWAMARAPGLRARLSLRRQTRAFARLNLLAVCAEMGILEQLRDEPQSAEQLATRLGLSQLDSLETLLRLGVALGELRVRNGAYRLLGTMSRALARADSQALRSATVEIADYHGLVYRNAPAHLREGRREPYLTGRAELIQSSSRIVEPALAAFVRGLKLAGGERRVLELGCGSAVYLCCVCQLGAHVSGVGVEADAQVAELARENVERWGLGERIEIVHGDARELPPAVNGRFDLITLYNNIYYFDRDERAELIEQIGHRLAPGGRLAIVSMLRGDSVAALQLDLVLASTERCARLPSALELRAALAAAGFTRVHERGLLPGEPFVAFVGQAP